MVGEFPRAAGRHGPLLRAGREASAAIADAIGDHYAPAGPNDRCPSAPVSVVVALADKLDTLTSFWTIGEKPTASRDPYALRRAALGIIRIVVENNIRLPLKKFFDADDLMAFFADRLKVQMREKGVRHDVVDAVFALGGEDDLVRLLARVEAVQSFLATEAGKNLLTAYGRAANIVRAEEKRTRHWLRRSPAHPMPHCWNKARKNRCCCLGRHRTSCEASVAARGFCRRDGGLCGLRGPSTLSSKSHSQCRREARFEIEQAEVAQPDTGHHGFGGGFLQDRGLRMAKWVYSFGDGKAEGRADMRNLLGGKGANLAEMSSLGLPVPPGFTITTEVCTWYYANGNAYPAS
jgi:hypothetical protein